MNNVHTLWQLLGGILFFLMLIFFAGVGIAHVINPDWFIKHSGVRGGGEMLKKWNRDGSRVAGAVFATFAIYLLYTLFRAR